MPTQSAAEGSHATGPMYLNMHTAQQGNRQLSVWHRTAGTCERRCVAYMLPQGRCAGRFKKSHLILPLMLLLLPSTTMSPSFSTLDALGCCCCCWAPAAAAAAAAAPSKPSERITLASSVQRLHAAIPQHTRPENVSRPQQAGSRGVPTAIVALSTKPITNDPALYSHRQKQAVTA